jgi:Tfp pilus assembly protein PilE
MVVVSIVGVLAAIGYPSLQAYIYKSRCAEATAFLGQIKLHQESFRSEFGQYVPVSSNDPTSISLSPTPPDDGSAIPFVPTAETDAWTQLGARPDSNVRFGYGWVSGRPDEITGKTVLNGMAPDMWFVAHAVGDVDANGTSITFEVYSFNTNVWVSNARGWD